MRFLIADDHGLFRDSMALWLKQARAGLAIDFAESLQELERAIDGQRYDLLLLDLHMPGMLGTASVATLSQQASCPPIIVVSGHDHLQIISDCAKAGAMGHVSKAADGEEILRAVEHVLNNKQHFPTLPRSHSRSAIMQLSEKEKRILTLITQGLSNKEIAEKTFLTEGSVKQYVSKLLATLEVDNRVQAGNKTRKLLGL